MQALKPVIKSLLPLLAPWRGIQKLLEEVNTSKNRFKTSIHELPEEILIIIIAALPLKDRKNTQLVCKLWSDVNKVRQIAKKEEFVCHACDDVDLFLQTLENSERNFLNIYFDCVNFSVNNRDRSLGFWKDCGWKIESLSFRCCQFSDNTLLFVIEYCIKMRNLTIRNVEVPLMSDTAFETLKQKNLRREYLKSLKLVICLRQIPFNFLKVLFDIHPNLDYFAHPYGYLTKTKIADIRQGDCWFEKKFWGHESETVCDELQVQPQMRWKLWQTTRNHYEKLVRRAG